MVVTRSGAKTDAIVLRQLSVVLVRDELIEYLNGGGDAKKSSSVVCVGEDSGAKENSNVVVAAENVVDLPVQTSNGVFLCVENTRSQQSSDSVSDINAAVRTSNGIFLCAENTRSQQSQNDSYSANMYGFTVSYTFDGVCPWQQTFSYLDMSEKK